MVMEARKFKADFEIKEEGGEVKKIIGYAAITDSEAPEVMGLLKKYSQALLKTLLEILMFALYSIMIIIISWVGNRREH